METQKETTRDVQKSTANRADLHHGRDIGLDVGLFSCGVGFIVDVALEVLRVESTRNETFVDTARRSHQTKRNDCKPKLPVEDLRWFTGVLQPEDVDGLLRTASHGGRFHSKIKIDLRDITVKLKEDSEAKGESYRKEGEKKRDHLLVNTRRSPLIASPDRGVLAMRGTSGAWGVN